MAAWSLSDALSAARSEEWAHRVDAAKALSGWAGLHQADAALLLLLADQENTAPVLATAEALLASGALAALRLFALGWAAADDSTRDWMADALRSALGSGSLEQDALEPLVQDDDEQVRVGAGAILNWASL